MNSRTIIAFLVVLWGLSEATHSKKNKLLYILIDGFRYDYVDAQPPSDLPGFNNFINKGVKAQWMTPIFPSISYPDWTTLVTGLYAESHGIVGNFFYDPEEKDAFILGDVGATGKKKWWNSEPIWTTSTKQGVKTAVVRWSRCDVQYDGVLPSFCIPFLMSEQEPRSFFKNAQKAVDLLESDTDFVLLYTPFIDTAGHYSGPDSEKLKKDLRSADSTLSFIQNELDERGLTDNVNIIIVSDHGMKDVTPESLRHVIVDDYVDMSLIESISEAGAFSNIKVLPGKVNEVYESLKKMPGINVYLKNDIPERFHYKHGKYVHDILIVADSETFISQSRSPKQIPKLKENSKALIGAHGFDPQEEKMRTIFFAKGPDFVEKKMIPPIQNVDVYPLVAHLIGVTPEPNNGTISSFKGALRDDSVFNSGTAFATSFTSLIATLACILFHKW